MSEQNNAGSTRSTDYMEVKGFNVITAILPRHTSSEVADFILDWPGRRLVAFNARGTLIRDRWYQALLPMLSPEQEVYQFLIPQEDEEILMSQIIALGQLRLAGSGAVISMRTSRAIFSSGSPLWQNGALGFPRASGAIQLGRSLVGIYCTAQSRSAESIARAAVRAGAHGPSISYSEGRGLRDRLGLLRITQNPDKEFIRVIVDEFDAEPVFEAMVRAGRLDQPGRGFIYQIPVAKGLVNLATVSASGRHSASLQQVIHAIDDIKGGADWRLHHQLPGSSERKSGFSFFGKEKSRRYLTNLQLLSCLAERKHAEALADAALTAGSPGITTAFGKLIESGSEKTGAGVRLNRERVLIKMAIKADKVDGILHAMQKVATESRCTDHCFYVQEIPRALTFLG
ncbi:hypothetical protein [Rubellicoccus peritrichatus]|uniref:Uncharacterized protein n=1 Tax=Rubellicoccus peritrichatus TaxID=3080537 RepID=A0AAQ3LC30_9BACT|nr:hypothetical protein [Puniceicoccus sp. CR14]WOO40738.1 hypothetical protein RZN69_19115 [Puniceicoccus sp. CR14]